MVDTTRLSPEDFMPPTRGGYDEGDTAPNVYNWTPQWYPPTPQAVEPYRPNMNPVEAIRAFYEYGPSMGMSQQDVSNSNQEFLQNIVAGLGAYPGYGSMGVRGGASSFIPGAPEYSRLSLGGVRRAAENIFPRTLNWENFRVGDQIGLRPSYSRSFDPRGLADEITNFNYWLSRLPGGPVTYGNDYANNPVRSITNAALNGTVYDARLWYDKLFGNRGQEQQ
jgi:hypothetical protein